MMKKNNTKKNRTARKLLPAAGMLAVSASMLATSTYAWFTMNKSVEVTGMQLKTKVGANLLICSDNVEEHYSSATLIEARKGLLEPVSSINGTTGSFWYTVNANARGQKESNATVTQYNENTLVANAVAGKYAYDKAFNGTYGVKDTTDVFTADDISMADAVAGDPSTPARDGAAYGYIDYVFYLKATSDAANQNLQMTECNLLYDGAAIASEGKTAGVDFDRAWRVGVFVTPLNASTQGGKGNTGAVSQIDPASAAANQKGILGLNGSTYFTTGQAQTGANTMGDVVNFKNGAANTTGVILDSFANSGTTGYYKVLVRAWLEGEDNTCNSETYAKLTDKWSLNCKFELGQGTAVTGLNTDATKVASTTATQEAVTDPIEVASAAAS